MRVTSTTVDGERVDYGYDRDGLLLTAGAERLTRDPDHGLVTGTRHGPLRQWYTTSSLGELVQHGASWLGGSFGETVTLRDGAGRLEEVEEAVGSVTTRLGYAYDADGRLTTEQRDGRTVASYVFDAQGRRTEAHYFDPSTGAEVESRVASYDARDRLTSDGRTSYTYDDAGRRASKTEGGAVTRYGYDELGHLTRVELPGGTVVEYAYDALGRRTGRTTDGRLDGRGTDTGWLYGSGPAPIATTLGGRVNVVYVYGTRPWVPDEAILPDAGGVRLEVGFLTDQRGSVRALVDLGTGRTLGRFDYDAFGRPSTPPPRGLVEIYGFAFAGGILDPDTGLLHLGARDYDPETGTWIEPDPIRFGGGDTNLYAYVGGDPVNAVDPRGTSSTLQEAAATTAGTLLGRYIGLGLGGPVGGIVGGAVGGALGGAIAKAYELRDQCGTDHWIPVLQAAVRGAVFGAFGAAFPTASLQDKVGAVALYTTVYAPLDGLASAAQAPGGTGADAFAQRAGKDIVEIMGLALAPGRFSASGL